MSEYATCKFTSAYVTKKNNTGIGNQLFQISNVLSFCKKNNLTPVFPQIKTSHNSIKYKDNIFRKLNTDSNKFRQVYREKSYFYNKIDIKLKYNILFEGYYQSEKYFLDHKDLILETFGPTEEIKKYIIDKYGEKLKNSTSIHVRQGDYLEMKNCYHNLLESDYYKNALEKITEENILVFSDNIEKVKNNKIFTDSRITFIENESSIIDFYLMSMCQNNVIGNSTFSWWAAYLNTNKHKIIYYPEKWFDSELSHLNTIDLIPENWINIKC